MLTYLYASHYYNEACHYINNIFASLIYNYVEPDNLYYYIYMPYCLYLDFTFIT